MFLFFGLGYFFSALLTLAVFVGAAMVCGALWILSFSIGFAREARVAYREIRLPPGPPPQAAYSDRR